jgi:hypothetical protein
MLIEMARHRGSKHSVPGKAQKVTRYAELKELYEAYADGRINLLVVLGAPGLGKGKGLKAALEGTGGLYIKGYRTHLKFHLELYKHKDTPVAIDDADDFLNNKRLREQVKHLTETDQYKKIDYGSTTKILVEAGVPSFFFTTSSCAIICNTWDNDDPICWGIESRAEFIHFTPGWEEVYNEIGKWFWDQEIYDYLWERLPFLREPDMRLVVRAWDRKKGGLTEMPWQQVIDAHVDDKHNLLLRDLLSQATDGRKRVNKPKKESQVKTRKPRVKKEPQEKVERPKVERKPVKSMGDIQREWCDATGMDTATFYRRKAELETWGCLERPAKIKLSRSSPPVEDRPKDEYVSALDDDEKSEDEDE